MRYEALAVGIYLNATFVLTSSLVVSEWFEGDCLHDGDGMLLECDSSLIPL